MSATGCGRKRLAGTPGRPLLRLRRRRCFRRAASPRGRGGTVRLLSFGRLLPYKGLDLLADALRLLGPRQDLVAPRRRLRPGERELAALRALPGVTVENRWVPEDEIGALLGWSDALVLPYREASQSGVAAAAIAAGRRVLATRVGGLEEQLADAPGAILCEPDAASLVAGLRGLIEAPRDAVAPPAADPRAAWHDLAASLMRQIDAVGV